MVSTKNIKRSDNMSAIYVPTGDCNYALEFILDQNGEKYEVIRKNSAERPRHDLIDKEDEKIYTYWTEKFEKTKYHISSPFFADCFKTYLDPDELFEFLLRSIDDPDVQYHIDGKRLHSIPCEENPPYLDPIISMKDLRQSEEFTYIFTPVCIYGDILRSLLIENRVKFQLIMQDIYFKDEKDEEIRRYWAKRFEKAGGHIFISPNTMLCFRTHFDPDELFGFLMSAMKDPRLKLNISQCGLKDHVSYIGAIE